MDQWYFLENGQTLGPVSQSDLMGRIEKSDLGPFDLVFKEGDEKWRSLVDCDEFSSCWQSLESKENEGEQEWVVLSGNPQVELSQYRQKGPYSKEEISDLICQGQLKYTDYAWKKGMSEWYQISHLPEWSQKTKKEISLAPLLKVIVDESAEVEPDQALASLSYKLPNQLESVETALNEEALEEVPPSPQVIEKLPPAVNEGLSEEEDREVEAHQSEVFSRFNQIRKWKKDIQAKSSKLARPPTLVQLIFFGLFVFLGSTLLILLSYEEQWRSPLESILGHSSSKKEEELSPGKIATEGTPGKGGRGKVQPRSTFQRESSPKKDPPVPSNPSQLEVDKEKIETKAASEERKVPHRLRLKVVGAQSSKRELIVSSDGSSHYPVDIEIFGQAGQILERRSLLQRRRVSIKKNNGTLALGNLPSGNYSFKAQSGETSYKITAFLGETGKSFKESLFLHRKAMSYWHQLERKELINQALSGESLVEEAQVALQKWRAQSKKWRAFYRVWIRNIRKQRTKPFVQVQKGSLRGLFHPMIWRGLVDEQAELLKWGGLVNQEIKSRRLDPDRLVELTRRLRSARQLKRQALRASLWR